MGNPWEIGGWIAYGVGFAKQGARLVAEVSPSLNDRLYTLALGIGGLSVIVFQSYQKWRALKRAEDDADADADLKRTKDRDEKLKDSLTVRLEEVEKDLAETRQARDFLAGQLSQAESQRNLILENQEALMAKLSQILPGAVCQFLTADGAARCNGETKPKPIQPGESFPEAPAHEPAQ